MTCKTCIPRSTNLSAWVIGNFLCVCVLGWGGGMKKASRPEELRQTDTSSSLLGTTDPSLSSTAVHTGRHTTRHLRAVYACHPRKRPRPNNAGGIPGSVPSGFTGEGELAQTLKTAGKVKSKNKSPKYFYLRILRASPCNTKGREGRTVLPSKARPQKSNSTVQRKVNLWKGLQSSSNPVTTTPTSLQMP